MSDPLFDPLHRKMHREVLRYAVSRAMVCAECGRILDVRRAVLVGSSFVRCGACIDLTVDRLAAEETIPEPTIEHLAAYLADAVPGTEVLDGRTASILVDPAPPARAPECEGQGELFTVEAELSYDPETDTLEQAS